MDSSRGGTLAINRGNTPTALHILQANLARCAQANELLNVFQKTNQHDITLIQEPYHHKNTITGFPMKHKIIAASENPKTAIIIHNNDIAVFPTVITDTLIALNITWHSYTALVINCYAPPKEDINNVIRKLSEITHKQNCHILVAGDFNAKNPLWGGTTLDSRGEVLADFFTTNSLTIANQTDCPPTFESRNGRSWIDVTVTSSSLTQHVHQWTVSDEETASDHKYIQTDLFLSHHEQIKRLTQNGTHRVLQTLKDDRWFHETTTTPINTANRLEHVINHLYEKIGSLKAKHSKHVNNTHPNKNPWWTTELEIERKRVRALRRRYQKSQGANREHYKSTYYQALKTYQNNITLTRKNSWQEFCSQIHKGNPFTLPYKIAGNKLKKTITIPAMLKEDGTPTTTIQESVSYILSTLFNTTSHDNETTDNTTYVATDELKDQPFTQQEVDSVVNNIKKHIAPGPDDLNTIFIQTLYAHHKSFFLHIFNSALSLGHFPKKWKNSKVVLIPKKDYDINHPKPAHFRPIALNSILGKVLETLLKNRIYHYLYTRDLLPKNQYGFTHNTSTTKALESVLHKVKMGNELDHTTVIISLDIKNAFNHIRHGKIAKYLNNNHCPPNLINLTSHSLTNRIVSYNTANASINVDLAQGSPQGSPLSPLLWNLTITDLLNTSFPENVHIQAFADDITLVIQTNTRKKIEQKARLALQIIEQWAETNGITFSETKCKYITLGKKYQSRPPHIKLGQHTLQHTKELKILGITLDTNLSFLPHLREIQKKTSALTSNLSRFSAKQWGLTPKQLRDIYIRGTERIILYGSPVWYHRHSHTLRKLQAIQRNPLLQITKAYRTTPNNALPILANIPPIHLTIERENTFHNILHNNTPFTHDNLIFQMPNIAHKTDIWHTHPAQKITIQHETASTGGTQYDIYTDGSATDDGCGAAFVVLDSSLTPIHKKQLKLPKHSSNFEAEAIAIIEALEYVSTSPPNSSHRINTDSLSCLKGLQKPDNRNPFVNAIKTKFMTAQRSHTIKLQYVKAHSGILGNELADSLAKQAIQDGTTTNTPVTTHFIKTQLRKKMHQEWAESWATDSQHTNTYHWIRHPKLIPPHFPANYYISQAITGHGRFPEYLHRFNKSEHKNCKCGEQADGINHYLTNCPLTTNERRYLEQKFPNGLVIHKPEIIKDPTTYSALENLVKKINDLIDQV